MKRQSYERHYREIAHDSPEWVRSPADARKTVLRIYKIACKLNGLATVEYEMTTRNSKDAVRRLKDRYLRVHGAKIRTHTVTPLAFAELVHEQRYDPHRQGYVPTGVVSASCITASRRNDRFPRELDYGEVWAKAFAATARRVVGGKPLEFRESSGRPPRVFAGWPFLLVRKVLRQDKGSGFEISNDFAQKGAYEAREEWTSIIPREFLFELPELLARLKALGHVDQSGTRWRVTPSGRKIQGLSQARISRRTALAVVDALKRRIRAINEHSTYCYKVSTVVLFGSVLDATKEKVGDVDIAFRLVQRHSGKKFEMLEKEARARCPKPERRKWMGEVFWPRTEVERAILGPARGIVQMRDLDELSRLVKTEREKPRYTVLHGSWQPSAEDD